ncbi:MAG: pyridoxamine 5'-phosphate oxidase [Acidimicrobiia bacterium]
MAEAPRPLIRPLLEAEVDPDPFVQFRAWFDDARTQGAPQPEAMTVASTDVQGRPSARLVLLRGLDDRGFTFFTNYGSRKARELDGNAFAALVFHWWVVGRQVRATGLVERVSEAESDEYWATRPRGSQVGAWASQQSAPVVDRAALEAAVAESEARFEGSDVPRPPDWGGYRVVPEVVEFWQHRDDRLHDRLQYTRAGDDWVIERLQP